MMSFLKGATIVWVILAPIALGKNPSPSSLSQVRYQKVEKVCDNNTIAIVDERSLLSCALSCKGNADCTTFGYRNDGLPEKCLLMGPYSTNKEHPTSYTGYLYYLMEAETKDSGTWMLIQRRINGEVDFFRNWTEYKYGFGDHCEFWLGNDKLHELTKDGEYRLRIELEDNDGVMAAAEWDTFIVGDEQSKYQLTVGGFNGANPPGDSMASQNGAQFSTFDADNDVYNTNCASVYRGAWWYKACHHSNLNGEYGNVAYGKGINWKTWRGHNYSLSASRMMIKKK